MNSLGFSSVEHMRRSRESSTVGCTQSEREDMLCDIARTYTQIPVDRLIRTCCQTLDPVYSKTLYDKIHEARGDDSTKQSEKGLHIQSCHKAGLLRLIDAINACFEENNQAGKLDIRWHIGYREARFIKDCKSLAERYKDNVELMRRLKSIRKQPQKTCKSWQDAVDIDLARYMALKSFSLESISLLCPAPTRQEEVALALGYANLKSANKCHKVAPKVSSDMIRDLAKTFTTLPPDRILLVCCEKLKGEDFEAMRSHIREARQGTH
jgi:hypothetical protein